jgi:hypothetical protein
MRSAHILAALWSITAYDGEAPSHDPISHMLFGS